MTADDATQALMDIVQSKGQPTDLRMDAILAMRDRFAGQDLPVLEAILKDPTETTDIRSAVALMLARLGEQGLDAERVFAVLADLADTEDLTLRNYIIQSLGMLGEVQAAPLLIQALKDRSNLIFASAAEALGKLGRPVVPYLLKLLEEGADDARCVAAWQLGELREREPVAALVAHIRSESNPDVSALCIWALGEIGYGPREVLDVLHWAKVQEMAEIRLRAEVALKKVVRHSN